MSGDYRIQVASVLLAALVATMAMPLTTAAYAQVLWCCFLTSDGEIIRIESDSEQTLQQIFDIFFGPNVIDASEETGKTTFPEGNYTFKVIANSTAFQNSFGWYPLDDPSQLNHVVANAAGATNTVEIPVDFGIYLDSPPVGSTWKSQPGLNFDDFDHFLTFDAPDGGTLVGAEDLPHGGDQDFNDGVVLLTPVDFIPPAPQVHLTVNSIDLSGNPVNGMWTVIRSTDDGTVLKTGFTPLTFTGIFGTDYNVSVENYDGITFAHWENGSTNKMRSVNLSSDTILTATYDTGDTLQGFTPLTFTDEGEEEQPALAVNAVSLDGSETLHMWTIIDLQSNDESGTTYKVYIHNYQDFTFSHWDDGSADMVRALTISEDTTITAFYQTAPVATVQSVAFAQKTALLDPEIDMSLHGVDANVTCPDNFEFGGTLFGFSARIEGDGTVTGRWSALLAPGAAADDGGLITSATITSTDFRLQGNWTGEEPIMCNGEPPLPSTVVIEGPCGDDVIATFRASNGVTGTFRGDVTCTV